MWCSALRDRIGEDFERPSEGYDTAIEINHSAYIWTRFASVDERRRAHGLDDNVHLLWDPQQQSRQQNWIEFQDYHLKLHEWQKKKGDGLQKDLDDNQKGAGDTEIEGSERAAQQERAIRNGLEYAERTLRWHEVILRWTEQWRLAMESLPWPPDEKGSGDQNSSFNHQRRSSDGTLRLSGRSWCRSPRQRLKTYGIGRPRLQYASLSRSSRHRAAFNRCRGVER